MQHVVIINHNAGSPYHGPNFRSYYSALGWVKNGIKATIVCSSFSHKLKKLPDVGGEYRMEMINGIRYVWLKTQPFSSNTGRLRNFIQFQRQLKRLFDIIQEPVDHVVCSSPPPFWIWFCRRFAAAKGASLIFEARDLWPDVIFETTRLGRLNPAAWAMRSAEISAYKHADMVVSVNESAIEIMKKRGLDPPRFMAIPNGVSIDGEKNTEADSDAGQLCAKLRSQKMFVVGYAGALSKVYGLAYLVRAARILKDKNIAFVLAGTGAYEKALQDVAQELPNFYLTGWIPKEQLHSFLTNVDICFAGLLNVPSFAYGSDSTKLYEYMKAARPLLHAISNKNSVVVQADCGIRVEPENHEAVVRGIKIMAAKPAHELDEMGDNGLKYLRKYRSYDVLTRKWLELFDLLKSRNSKKTWN